MYSYLVFIRDNWILLGFGFTAVFWGNFGQSFFIAWFGADIQQSLGLSARTYGGAYSAATMASALTVVWLGAMVDRVALRSYAVAISLGLCAAALAVSQARGLLTLMLAFFLLRLFGQSLLPHTGITSMARFFRENRGKAISVAMSGVPAGEVVLPLLAVALMTAFGWQTTFVIIAGGAVVVLIPAFLWLLKHGLPYGGSEADLRSSADSPSQGRANAAEPTRWPGRRQVLRDYRFWLALPGLMSGPFMITGIFIHQNFLVASKGWTMTWLATCFTLYGLVHWLSSLFAGSLVDRFGAVRLLPLPMLPLLVALAIAAFMPGWWSAPLMMTFLGMAAGGSPPITGSLWPVIYGTPNLGAIRSMNMAIMVMSTAISPVLFGYYIDGGINVAWLFGASVVYVAVALAMTTISYPLNQRSLIVHE